MLRKLFTICFILVSLLSTSLSPVRAATDNSLSGLLERLLRLTIALDSKGYSIAHIGVDRLTQGGSQIYTRDLQTGHDYLVVGIGGIGIQDLDITLYDENSRKIDEDTSTDNMPIVEVTPRWSGKFQMTTSLYSLEPGYSRSAEYFYVYVIAYR